MTGGGPGMEAPTSLTPDHPDYTREVYSVKQAAAYLRVSVDRVYEEAAARRLAHRRHRRTILFSQADLDAWRQAGRVDVAGAPASVATPRPRATAQKSALVWVGPRAVRKGATAS